MYPTGKSRLALLSQASDESTLRNLQTEYALGEITNLAYNENPLGASPNAIAILDKTASLLHKYPGDIYSDLKSKIAQVVGADIDAGNIIIGNGSTEVLLFVVNRFLETDDEIIISEPTWSFYRTLAAARKAVITSVKNENYKCNLTAILAGVTQKTKLIIVCNPNNPTGTYISPTEISDLLMCLPENITVVLDEAYCEFVEAARLSETPNLCKKHRLIVTRTFSKIYGLAALRIGYGIANHDLIMDLHQTRLPYSNNTLALLAAKAALGDQLFVERTKAFVKQERERLTLELQAYSVTIPPSQTNFIMVESDKDANILGKQLLKRGIWVRSIGDSTLRISIGTEDENDRLLENLTKLLS